MFAANMKDVLMSLFDFQMNGVHFFVKKKKLDWATGSTILHITDLPHIAEFPGNYVC